MKTANAVLLLLVTTAILGCGKKPEQPPGSSKRSPQESVIEKAFFAANKGEYKEAYELVSDWYSVKQVEEMMVKSGSEHLLTSKNSRYLKNVWDKLTMGGKLASLDFDEKFRGVYRGRPIVVYDVTMHYDLGGREVKLLQQTAALESDGDWRISFEEYVRKDDGSIERQKAKKPKE